MKLTIIIGLLAIVCLSGCDQSTPAYFEIAKASPGVTNDGFFYVDITVKNTGGGAGYKVTCQVTASDPENDEVLATGETLFRSGRNIESDESATDRVTFWGLGDLTIDQVELVYDLTWQDLSPLP
jgi:uncharacterized protein (TIGR02588 family)